MTSFLSLAPWFSLFLTEGLEKCTPFPAVSFQPEQNGDLCFYLFAFPWIEKTGCSFPAAMCRAGLHVPASPHAWPCQTKPSRKWNTSPACLQELARTGLRSFVYSLLR